ncbi:hypothetical protein [Arthrobacter rhizosphaerae]|uniref:hypothetical protein n=1 Tax=Arthrobacter rhizosphaerae TaxID=2855490 RepID=UPI001FF1781B|nr:hypothetical protein [Arthrobacter rhizosphaerae]
MDPLERLLRDANPVSDTSDSPRDRDQQLKALLSELRKADAAPKHDRAASDAAVRDPAVLDPVRGGNRAADVRGTVGRRGAPRRLIPVLAVMTVVLGLAAAGFGAAVNWFSDLSPAPAGSPSPTSTAPDGWRLAGFAPNPAGSETHIHLMVAEGWELIDSLPDDDYPARTAFLHPVDPLQQGLVPQIMLYYGPSGPRYDPAACAGPQESFVELDSSPVNIPFDASVPGAVPPRFVYRVSTTGDRVVASFGITTRPPSTSIDPCNQYFQIRAARAGYLFSFSSYSTYVQGNPGWLSPVQRTPMEFSSMDAARAFLETDDYAIIKRTFSSVTISAP